MSRISLVVYLLITVVAAGCQPTSNSSDATSGVSEPQPSPDPASPDEPAEPSSADTPSSTDAVSAEGEPPAATEGDNGESPTTPVKTSVGRNTNGDSEETLDITFDDIRLPIQQDMVFRPFMLTNRVRELDGKRIRISGYMLPDSKTKGITQFVLLKNMKCKFGPGGQADHLLNVLMVEGNDTVYRDDPISVEGTLVVKPFTGPDGNTWSIYDLACESVTRYRPRR